jgi:hypothetical protein
MEGTVESHVVPFGSKLGKPDLSFCDSYRTIAHADRHCNIGVAMR